VNGFDFVVIALLLATAIVLLVLAAKKRHILKNNWSRSHSLLELDSVPQLPHRNLPQKRNIESPLGGTNIEC
jgi:hypothetical protein